MRKSIFKKISFLPLSLFIYSVLLPIKSFALEYKRLEGEAFSGFDSTVSAGTNPLGAFLSQAFQFGLAIAAALAVIMIVWGGVEIMTTDSWTGKSSGKQKIQDAIWGLLLALVSWLILYTINPDILNWSWLANTTP